MSMKIKVFVKIGRRHEILGWDGEKLTVSVDAPPVNGIANSKMIEMISDWLNVSKSRVQVTSGHTARYKTLEIDLDPDLFQRLADMLPQLPRQQTLFS